MVKILLIQIREEPWKVEWDRKSFLAGTGLKDEELKSINIVDGSLSPEDFDGYEAAIIGGSKFGVYDDIPNKNALKDFIKKAAKSGLPVLGICFGAQLVAESLGGKVITDFERNEFGTFEIQKTEQGIDDFLLEGLPKKFLAQCSHNDRIVLMPNGSVCLAKSARCPIQAFKIPGTKIYGIQFHPERSKEAFQDFLKYEIEQSAEKNSDPNALPLKQILKNLKTAHADIILKNFLKWVSA